MSGGDPRHLPAAAQADLAERIAFHGQNIYGAAAAFNSSPLYARLCLDIAADPDLLTLIADADRAAQVANLLFAAVHYLLLANPSHPLAAFFPDLTDRTPAIDGRELPRPAAEAYPVFRAFCLEHAAAIRHLVTTRRVQTNEVRRCAILLPAFALVSRRAGGRPLALIEIGASAGLLMLWDQYRYDYGPAGTAGDPAAPLLLTCEPRGPHLPSLPTTLPTVVSRIGLDLNPIDVRDDNAMRWLRALIWPEHADRVQMLEAALAVARQQPPHIVAGNATQTLPALLAAAPPDAALCVYSSYALNQMPADVRQRVLAALTAAAHARDLYRISQEWYGQQAQPRLELFTYTAAETRSELLAHAESHGRWIEWLGPNM
ncbi:MAG: hypothetical protein OJF49_004305 [Ktedonobacterales bacterium]|jgi:hypothetical protein|nr:MAG: hypothetical protein OJF49_004305 [Ktedonobacterales bacterium]